MDRPVHKGERKRRRGKSAGCLSGQCFPHPIQRPECLVADTFVVLRWQILLRADWCIGRHGCQRGRGVDPGL
jgi:hypothetical protein